MFADRKDSIDNLRKFDKLKNTKIIEFTINQNYLPGEVLKLDISQSDDQNIKTVKIG